MKNETPFQKAPWFLLLTLLFLLSAASPSARAQDEPTIIKDSVQVKTHDHDDGPAGRYGDLPSWTPRLNFRVNDPIPSGSRIWVEFSYVGKKGWLTSDCSSAAGFAGSTPWTCPGDRDFGKEKSTRFLGIVDFTIHISNELLGTNAVLFRGKAKVGKTPLVNPKNPTFFDYYVDEDWRVPIGYLRRDRNDRTLNIEMWFRGSPGEVSPHLFQGGKEVAKGINCGGALFDPAQYQWWPVNCEFFAGDDEVKALNPGEYEIKVLQQGRLTRVAKLTVDADGSHDNGIATANKLGSAKVIVPFKILVDLAPWDKLAWKTGAFYGNPLTGFTVP